MKITSPALAFRFFRARFSADVEEFWSLALTPGKDVLATELLFRGTVNECPIHPRDIFRFALRHNASSLIVAHNHPTGIAFPSRQDLRITRQLKAAATIMQIPLDDHLILAGAKYYSFVEAGKIKSPDGQAYLVPD